MIPLTILQKIQFAAVAILLAIGVCCKWYEFGGREAGGVIAGLWMTGDRSSESFEGHVIVSAYSVIISF
jgi:hypothetical protein